MKRIYVFTFLISCHFLSVAQITLTRTDFPVDSDIIASYYCDTSSLTEGNAGSNVTWDFSSLNIVGLTKPALFYDQISPTDLHASWSSGFWGEDDDYHTDSSSYNYAGSWNHQYGMGSWTWGDTYSNDLLEMIFPFTYNNYFTDSFYFYRWDHPNLQPTTGHYVSGFDSVMCDGWGTIILPFGTFNALRVYRYHAVTDTDGAGGYTQSVIEGYDWYTNNHQCALLTERINSSGQRGFTVCMDASQPLLVHENVSSSNQEISLRTISACKYKIDIRNAFTNEIEIVLNDLLGRIILKERKQISDKNFFQFDVDLGNLNGGLYFITLYEKDFQKSFKLINQKF